MTTLTLVNHNVSMDSETKGELTRLLLRALRRFSPQLVALEVRLRDANGPRGGVDKICSISFRPPVGKRRTVSSRHHSILGAAQLCARKVRRAIVRRREKSIRPRARHARNGG